MTQDGAGAGDRSSRVVSSFPSDDAHDVLAGGGELGGRMRATEWSEAALGPTSSWPQSLRSALSICLGSRFPIAIYWGPELALLYNDAWSPILGEKHPWALGQPGREVWPEIWDTIGPMFQHVIKTGEATYSEDSLLLMRRHGYTEECFFNFTFSPIRGEGGRVDGIFNAVIETTYRVLAERRTRALRDLGERLALAASTNDVARLTIESLAGASADVAFCALYLVEGEPPAARLLGSGGLEAGGPAAPLTIALSADRQEGWPLAEAWQSKRIVTVDGLTARLGVALPGGSWPEPASSALIVPVVLPSGEHPLALLVVGTSPRRAIDEQYVQFAEKTASQLAASFASAQRREELAALDRAKTAFFSNVSHEFRTPLTLMLGPIEDMRAQPLTPAERERVELLHRNALRLVKLVNSLLDFSRIEAGRVEASFEPTDLASLTTDLSSTFRSAIERAGLTFVVDCPPIREPVLVDRDMWEKIVLNLLSNAFKFTFEGTVSVRLRETAKAAVLEVSDTGTGIAEHELPRLFERFHRVEGARSRSHEGSGIGLALVHELVRMQGGEIEVQSRLNEGTAFRVSVPFGKPHTLRGRLRESNSSASTAVGARAFVEEALRWTGTLESAAPAQPEPAQTAKSGQRERILVADDNLDMRDYVARLLRERWEVETVADGESALAAIRRNRPDLVVSDVMMPGLDGFALLRTIRGDAQLRTLPVVLLSARAGEEATSEGLAAGADDYLLKPFSARDLLMRVASRLATAKARDRERRRFLSMLERVPAIVNFLRGPDLVFEFAHPKAVEALGGRQLVGKPVLEAIPEYRDQPEIMSRLLHVLKTGLPSVHHELAVRIVGKMGPRSTYWDSAYVPVHDDAGHVDGVMTFDLDVTDRVLARRGLEATSRAKDEFLATMSHELRTPLNAMLGWAKILESERPDDGKLARGLAIISRNAQSQARLVDDLLDVSRIVSGKLHLHMKRTGVGPIIQAAAEVVRPAAEAKRVRLVLDLDPELGATVGDPDRLQQVVWNLLTNAVRFTPSNGRVTVTALRSGSMITIRVQDTGLGIPEEHLPHIFERFRQVDSSTTRAHGGLGLGLAIVRHLVEGHGGTVSADSAGPNLGATFTVILPIRAVSAASDAFESGEAEVESVAEARAIASSGSIANVRALVVEDDPDSLELVRVVLEGAGAKVTAVTSARDALAAPGPFDIVISDIGMPEMDGYAFIRRIRARDAGATVPALALTAYARGEDAALALRAGYQEHLAKPVDSSRLLEAVKTWARPGRSR